MNPGLVVSRCAACRAGFFPPRLFCPRCGGQEFEDDLVHDGVVEQSTIVRHAARQADWKPRRIGSVRTSDGQVIVAGLEEELPNGQPVRLFLNNGTPIARRAG
jgi:uncharacterized protein